MAENKKTIVAGLGEVGKPLFQLLSPHMEVVGVDIAPVGPIDNVGVLHVCYPFQIPDFNGVTARYIPTFQTDSYRDQQHGRGRHHTCD